ncbi:MAG TPA: VCBS repeat-containing protein [Candidatus Eisenbacteria bacterium]|nr:VCBS repeat-containing protein [Candidatus Eisenbacteria bacterium]
MGDVNGDGYADVMVGEHDWTGERRNQGRTLLFLGGPRGLSPQPAQVLTDEPQSQRFGQVVCGVGDINHDGYADVAVGAPLHTRAGGDVGLVQIYFGGPAARRTGASRAGVATSWATWARSPPRAI